MRLHHSKNTIIYKIIAFNQTWYCPFVRTTSGIPVLYFLPIPHPDLTLARPLTRIRAGFKPLSRRWRGFDFNWICWFSRVIMHALNVIRTTMFFHPISSFGQFFYRCVVKKICLGVDMVIWGWFIVERKLILEWCDDFCIESYFLSVLMSLMYEELCRFFVPLGFFSGLKRHFLVYFEYFINFLIRTVIEKCLIFYVIDVGNGFVSIWVGNNIKKPNKLAN